MLREHKIEIRQQADDMTLIREGFEKYFSDNLEVSESFTKVQD